MKNNITGNIWIVHWVSIQYAVATSKYYLIKRKTDKCVCLIFCVVKIIIIKWQIMINNSKLITLAFFCTNYLQIIVFKFLDSKGLCRHGECKQKNFTYVLRIIGDVLINIFTKICNAEQESSHGLPYWWHQDFILDFPFETWAYWVHCSSLCMSISQKFQFQLSLRSETSNSNNHAF